MFVFLYFIFPLLSFFSTRSAIRLNFNNLFTKNIAKTIDTVVKKGYIIYASVSTRSVRVLKTSKNRLAR